mmetsp:Transcript_132814/g.412953  ORF Transcript_132814/g.412953 Transcript_132814/m.412953 type:complete len:239 (-) Transcript_132814:134-850(-)
MAWSLKPPSATQRRAHPARLTSPAQCSRFPSFRRSPVPSAPQSARQDGCSMSSGYQSSFSSAFQSCAPPVLLRSVKPKPRSARSRRARRNCDQAPGPPQRSRKQAPLGKPSRSPEAAASSASFSPARFSCSWPSRPSLPEYGKSWSRATRWQRLRPMGGGGLAQRLSSASLARQSPWTSSSSPWGPSKSRAATAESSAGFASRAGALLEESEKRCSCSSKGGCGSRPGASGAPARPLK